MKNRNQVKNLKMKMKMNHKKRMQNDFLAYFYKINLYKNELK